MSSYVFMPDEQRRVATLFIARLCCHQATPCSTCLDYCRTLTERAYPILEAAFLEAAKTRDWSAGWGMLLTGTIAAEPNPDDPREPQTRLPLED